MAQPNPKSDHEALYQQTTVLEKRCDALNLAGIRLGGAENQKKWNDVWQIKPQIYGLDLISSGFAPFSSDFWNLGEVYPIMNVYYVKKAVMNEEGASRGRLWAIAEAWRPNSIRSWRNSNSEALVNIKRILNELLSSEQLWTDDSQATIQNYIDWRAEDPTRANYPDLPYDEDAKENTNADVSLAIVRFFLSLNNLKVDIWKSRCSQAAVNLVCAFARVKNMSSDRIAKIAQNLSKNLRVNVDIESDVVKALANEMVPAIENDDDISELLRRWNNLVPYSVNRVRFVIEQAKFNNLTQLYQIGQVMLEHPNFPWQEIAALLPSQFRGLNAAFQRWINDPYYGFKPKLDPVKTIDFYTYFYVAKQLRVRLGGHLPNFARYAGHILVPEMNTLSNWIDRYVETAKAAANWNNVAPHSPALARLIQNLAAYYDPPQTLTHD